MTHSVGSRVQTSVFSTLFRVTPSLQVSDSDAHHNKPISRTGMCCTVLLQYILHTNILCKELVSFQTLGTGDLAEGLGMRLVRSILIHQRKTDDYVTLWEVLPHHCLHRAWSVVGILHEHCMLLAVVIVYTEHGQW